MIVTSAEGEISTTIKNSDEYTLADSGKMYEILYHNIYSDPVAAVVREICSNAYDSHCQAGRQDVPFRVNLPNIFHPFFEVEDFGVGMSEQDTFRIYRQYGASTKSTTDTLVGGFGLGSKTPFAYGKTFNTRTRKDGIECNFLNYIGEDGRPKIKKLSESKTGQHNGVKISVSVKREDFGSFSSAAGLYLSFYPIRPEVIGSNFKFDVNESDIKQLYKYGIARINSFSGYIVMGCVPYKCTYTGYHDSCMIVPIGTLRPTASREGLDLSDVKTVEMLKDLASEKTVAARLSVSQEYCSSGRLSSRISAMRNSGSMPILLDFIGNTGLFDGIKRGKIPSTFDRFTSRKCVQSCASVAAWIANGRKIHVLYGNVSDYKRRACIKLYSPKKYYGSQDDYILMSPRLSEKTIDILKAALPDSQVGISWESMEDVWSCLPKRKKSASTISGKCLVYKNNAYNGEHDIKDVDTSSSTVLLTKERSFRRVKYSLWWMFNNSGNLSVPSDVVVMRDTKAVRKLISDKNPQSVESWKVKADPIYLDGMLSYGQFDHFIITRVLPLIIANSKQSESTLAMLKLVSYFDNCSEHYRDVLRHGDRERMCRRIVGFYEENERVRKVKLEFDSWYKKICASEPILKYVSGYSETSLEDAKFYLERKCV